MNAASFYRGRFAPSPTGPLHFGSLVAAIGSYLDAKHHNGIWLVRLEDLDTPRCVPEAADDILRTLDTFGLHSDEPVLYQSQRSKAYEEALQQLKVSGAVYPCCCSRKEIADSALHGIEGLVYPGTCRQGIPAGREKRAWRVRTDYLSLPPLRGGARSKGATRMGVLQQEESGVSTLSLALPLQGGGNVEITGSVELYKDGIIQFDDDMQGHFTQNLEYEIGDFVMKRADRLFAYQLAVVVDDAFQNITHIVRGADLLASTPRQIYLQRLLGLSTPAYMHLPVAVNAAGEKLSKQTLAAPVNASNAAATMFRELEFLQQQPPAELLYSDVRTVLNWAVQHWGISKLRGVTSLPAPSII